MITLFNVFEAITDNSALPYLKENSQIEGIQNYADAGMGIILNYEEAAIIKAKIEEWCKSEYSESSYYDTNFRFPLDVDIVSK